MKFFITNPIGYHGNKHTLVPIGPLYIATIAKKKGCDVCFYDAYLENPTSDEFRSKLIEFQPDIIGISCNVEDRFAAFETAKLAKQTFPNSLLIMGGPFPTIAHEQIINKLDCVDIVVRHEGEKQIADIIDVIREKRGLDGVMGITYRQNGKTVVNQSQSLIPDLNDLPTPDFSLIDPKRYKSYIPPEEYFDNLNMEGMINQSINERPMASLIFGRGCPFNCIFCSAEKMWHRRLRMISPERALTQVKYFLNLGIRDFVFQDDHLLANKEWFMEFANRLKELNDPGDPIRYACLARVDSIDDSTARLIRESGGRIITLGIENLSDNVLKLMNKKITVDQIWRTLEILYKYKVTVRGGIMIETPGETLDDISENIKQYKRLRKYIIQSGHPGPIRIYPGSDIEKLAIKEEKFDGDWIGDYHNERNYIIGSPVHIPIYENLPHEKVLPHLIFASLASNNHYLSRLLIRKHLVNLTNIRDRKILSKFKERLLVTKGVFKFLIIGSPIKCLKRFKFLIKVLTIK